MSTYLQGNKYLWRLPAYDPKMVCEIAALYNLSMPIAQTLINRGFADKKSIDAFLFSSFEKDVPHPRHIKDAEKSVDRILYAIAAGEKILIAGDYDVDGITSSAMMLLCLLPLGANINFFLPNRVKDGYGLSVKTVERAAASNYKVIITVDNGITAFDPAIRARELGVDLIITDHHRPHDHLPDAFAIVNPNQKECAYPFKVLAGVGVTFKLLSLLYETKKMELPPKVYELLMLGTIADVVPLIGENRYWVRHGLTYINKYESPSFAVLKKNGKVTKERLSSTDIGFSIAPQINALGRLQDARQGVRFLIDSNLQEVEQVGAVLLELNEARKEIERSIYAQVDQEIIKKNINLEHENVILAAHDAWPPGVIGLVASRLMSAYGRPTILFHLTKQGIAKGSCRSIPEFNMFDALTSCSDLLMQFGGHSMAAGLSVSRDNLPALKSRLEALVAQQLKPEDLKLKLSLDADVSLGDLTKKFISDMAHLEPFGNENKEPNFYIKNVVQLQKPTLLKDAHVKCKVFADGVIKPVIFFNRPELFELLLKQDDEPFAIAGQVVENHWNDSVNIELRGIDIAGLKG
ncbi:MAG TPA: single-stranded-DNA-specific exonuclease RecJ [Candidatus Babeliales bacterium]|nr:single-stranded-DNA-specific exonuclease RecJ [Candidatus Babeliales bacterium]